MFKLPVCPYCKTVYHFGEVRKNKSKPKYNQTTKKNHIKILNKIQALILWGKKYLVTPFSKYYATSQT